MNASRTGAGPRRRARKSRRGSARRRSDSERRDAPELEEVVIEIDDLAAGGDGVGRLGSGKIVFVQGVAKGDRVRVVVPQSERRFERALRAELLEPGPDRVEPRCPVFGECGGCAWQHIHYRAQLDAKRKIVSDALGRIGRLDALPEIRMVESPSPYGYRGRTRVRSGPMGIGYRRRRDHGVVPIASCPILVPRLDDALRELGRSIEGRLADEGGHSGDVDREWELAVGDVGGVSVAPIEPDGARGPRAASRPVSHGAGNGVELIAAAERIGISHGGFFQGNALLRDALVHEVTSAVAAVGATGLLLELFAGAGFFTLALARRFDVVIAVESDASALRDLEANLARAELDHVELREARVEDALPELGAWRPDVILLDPPRAGLGLAECEELRRFAARRIVYLSCDPATLARDLGALASERGPADERGDAETSDYRITSLTAFDLFPQTPHVEVLAVLDRVDTQN